MIKEFDVKIPGWNGFVGRPALLQDDITQFMNSGAKNCEVAIKTKAAFTRNNYCTAIKRMHVENSIACLVRQNRVFLVKKEENHA